MRTVSSLVQLLHDEGLQTEVAVARDGRASGARIAQLVVDVLLAHGVDVVDLGIVSTPTAKLTARRRSLGAAVIVTGSHLDPTWNGIKLVAAPTYLPLDVRLLPEPQPSGRRRTGQRTEDTGAVVEHASAIVSSVDAAAIRRASLAVSVAGGAGATAEVVLGQLGCRTDQARADLGLVLDADGDRLELIDEAQRPIDSELTLPLVAQARHSQSVVKGADTSGIVDLVVKPWGGGVRSVPTGELYLVQSLLAEGGDLAGEGNGGVIVPAVGLARDGLAAAASILALMARESVALSALAASVPKLARLRSTVPCSDPVRATALLARLAAGLGLELIDAHRGLRVDRHGAWALVRASATEPLLRITAEAPDVQTASALHNEVRQALLTELEGT